MYLFGSESVLISVSSLMYIYRKDGLHPYNFAGGTAKTLDGNIAIVSVFVNTEEFPWDFNELMETEAGQYYLNDLNIAVNYLTEKAHEYGKSPNYI